MKTSQSQEHLHLEAVTPLTFEPKAFALSHLDCEPTFATSEHEIH